MSGPTAASSASTSPGGTNVTGVSSDSNAARFAGWPVADSAPTVQAVERALERHDAVLPGRLARVLDRGLDRLRPRVAEERLRARAAEPVGEPAGELCGRQRAEEVRGVPDSVELLVRGAGVGRGVGGRERRTAIPPPKSR